MGYRIDINYKKNEVKKYGDESKLQELINLVTECSTLEEFQNTSHYKDPDRNFLGNYGNWKDSNATTTPKEWYSIYKYADDYGNWTQITNSCPVSWKHKTVLDFGAGAGIPWVDAEDINLYLLEVNLTIASRLKKLYKYCPKVKIVTSLDEIPKDIRFDFIYSNDVIEHVRYTNEHLELLHHLGNDNCHYTYIIDTSDLMGHVINLHEDTKIKNEFWNDKK